MSEWISVKDRLPERSARLLICHNGEVHFGAYLAGDFLQPYTPYNIRFSDVTHWMPLPEVPK